jgi:polygalacturonase
MKTTRTVSRREGIRSDLAKRCSKGTARQALLHQYRELGTRGDGKTDDTKGIQAAIDALTPAGAASVSRQAFTSLVFH